MKVDTFLVPEATIEDFADKNGLAMEVHERSPRWSIGEWNEDLRYYAHFTSVEIMDGHFLISVSGSGRTPEKAIYEYARRISEHTIVVRAYADDRREFEVPRLVPIGERIP